MGPSWRWPWPAPTTTGRRSCSCTAGRGTGGCGRRWRAVGPALERDEGRGHVAVAGGDADALRGDDGLLRLLDAAAVEAVRLACPLHMAQAIGKPQVVVSLPIVYSLAN